MDIINNILNNYGGRQIQHIFKSYLILSLIIKQLLFFLFFSPSNPPVIDHPENGIEIFSFKTNDSENEIDDFSRLLLLFNLLNPEEEEISIIQNLF